MGNTVQLGIRITSDTTQAASGLNNTSGILGKVKIAALAVAGALVGIGVAAGKYAFDAISAAGDLEQSIGAIDVVFKDSAGQMHTWAQDAAQSVGLAANEYNELGTLIGTQLKNGGTAMDELAPKTNNLIELGADLSSMFGGTTREAVEALSSALKGERDPIERYGVSLNQASIDAKAAELGFEKVGNSLSAEASQAATLALIMDQTADAHGNFARESNTLQGQQQRFNAQMENTKTIIGMALLPVATALFTWFNDKLGPAIGDLAGRFAEFVSGLDIIGWWESLTAGVSGASGVLDAIAPLIAGVVDWFGQLRPSLDALAAAFTERFQAIWSVVSEFAAGLWAVIEPLLPKIAGIFTGIGDVVRLGVDLITELWSVGTQAFLIAWDLVGPPLINTVGTVFTTIVGIVGPAINLVKTIITTVLAALRGDWTGAWNGIKNILSAAWDLIKAVVKGAIDVVKSVISGGLDIIKTLWSRAWDAIKSALSPAWDAIKTAVSNGIQNIRDFFGRLPGQIGSALAGLPSQLAGIGRNMMNSFIGAVRDAAARIASAVTDVIQGAINAGKRLLGIASPSRVFRQLGTWTGQGLVDGLLGQASAVARAGEELVDAAIPSAAPTLPIPGYSTAAGTAGGRAPIIINVTGALDPAAVARQIRDILTGDARIRGAIDINGQILP